MSKPATNGDQFMAYMRGFYCGAGIKFIDDRLAEHADELIRSAYLDGWADGRVAAKAASAAAEKRFGYSPSILRACESDDNAT